MLEFEKKERAKEVAELDSQKQKITSVVAQLGEEVSVKKQELQNVTIEKELAEEATQKICYGIMWICLGWQSLTFIRLISEDCTGLSCHHTRNDFMQSYTG